MAPGGAAGARGACFSAVRGSSVGVGDDCAELDASSRERMVRNGKSG